MPNWPEAGWYFEPGGPQVARWWDGVAWGAYAPAPAPTPAPTIDRFGLPVDSFGLPDSAPPQQTAVLDPPLQAWAPPGGVATANKPRTALIVLIVIAVLLVLFVPAIDVVRLQHHKAQVAAAQA